MSLKHELIKLNLRLQAAQGQASVAAPAITRRTAIGGLMTTPTAGLGGQQPAPMNAPRAGQPGIGVQPGVTAGVVVAQYVIVTGTAGGVFVYTGTPAAGNPPIAWMSSVTTDPYGNTLPSTTGVAGSGTFSAGDTIVNDNGIFVYSGTPAAGNLAASITNAAGTDEFGNGYIVGIASYLVGTPTVYTQIADGEISLGAGATGGICHLFSQTNGNLVIQPGTGWIDLNGLIGTASGLTGYPVITNADTSVLSTGDSSAVTDITKAWTVPAGDALVNTWYEVECFGGGTWEGETLTLGVSLDGGSPICQLTLGSGFLASGDTFNFTWKTKVLITSFSTTAGWLFSTEGLFTIQGSNVSSGTNSNTAALAGTQNIQTVNSATSHTLALTAKWGGTATGLNLTSNGSKYTRLGSLT